MTEFVKFAAKVADEPSDAGVEGVAVETQDERRDRAPRGDVKMEEITEAMVDRAAKVLRETTQAGKRLNEWSDLPRSAKKKWLNLAHTVLDAALGEDT